MPGPDVSDDDAVRNYAASNGSTVYHGVGTCQMGCDAGAVVNTDLKLHGFEGVRVVDASIMPSITSTNTNATTIAIAEKAADLIRHS